LAIPIAERVASSAKSWTRRTMSPSDSGVDVQPDGTGVVTGQRLYQLVRQKGPVRDRTFTITFLDPGAEAFSFTFG
jgi:hypothetical protein